MASRKKLRKSAAGILVDANDLARPSRWGNIYHIAQDDVGWCVYDENDQFMMRAANKLGARHIAVNKFRACIEFWDNPALFEPLRGKNLACFCDSDGPCHADVLIEFSNRPTREAA